MPPVFGVALVPDVSETSSSFLFFILLKMFKDFDLITLAFRFVNVEILPPRERRRSRSRSLRRVKRRPRTIAEVMRVRNFFYIEVFWVKKLK